MTSTTSIQSSSSVTSSAFSSSSVGQQNSASATLDSSSSSTLDSSQESSYDDFVFSDDPRMHCALWKILKNGIIERATQQLGLSKADIIAKDILFAYETGTVTIPYNATNPKSGVRELLKKLFLLIPENEKDPVWHAARGITYYWNHSSYVRLHKKGVTGKIQGPSPFVLDLDFTGGRKWADFSKNLLRFQSHVSNVSERAEITRRGKLAASVLEKLRAIVETQGKALITKKSLIEDVEEEEIQKYERRIQTFVLPLKKLNETDSVAVAWALYTKPHVVTEPSADQQIDAATRWIRIKRKELASALGIDLQSWGEGFFNWLWGEQTKENKPTMQNYLDSINLLGITDPALHIEVATRLQMKEEPTAGSERFLVELARHLETNSLDEALQKVEPLIDVLLDQLTKEDLIAIKETFYKTVKSSSTTASSASMSSSSCQAVSSIPASSILQLWKKPLEEKKS